MWPHFVHLFWRTVHGMPVLVSSNWASWLILIGAFLLTECLLLWREREHMREWWNKRWSNLALSILVTLIVYTSLFLWSTVQTIYDDHHDSIGRWQAVVKEKNSLTEMLQQRDEYIKRLESRSCPACPPNRKQGLSNEPQPSQPRSLSDLQRAVLQRDLGAGVGLKVRINAVGTQSDTLSFTDELRQAFRGWIQSNENVPTLAMTVLDADVGTPSELEFAIPNPQDPSVQLAIHAFDHAHIAYTKNVSPYAWRGSSNEPIPALTINVRDR